MFNTKGNVMKYEIAKIEDNGSVMFASDLTIRNIETGEEVVCDCVKIWDTDQYSLAYMFQCVKKGTWATGECMLSEEDEIALQNEMGIDIETYDFSC